VRDVDVVLGETQIVRSASLEVLHGEIHLLIGPNGAGKTTFANVITGHVPLTAGVIHLDGRPLTGAVHRRIRRGIGRKFQVPRVFERLDVHANLTVARRAARDTASSSATRLGGLPEHSPVDELSHGQRQRLELQMVLDQSPSLVVLDEPTAGMTRSERLELAELIRSAAGDQTFLVVEHDMDFVEAVADRVSFMQDGRVLVTGTFTEVIGNAAVRAAYLGSPPAGRAERGAVASSSKWGALRARALSVRHGRLESVRGVDLDLSAGATLGVLGRNGAGKTTLLHGLMGLLPVGGELELDGQRIDHRPAWWRARHGVALVPQGRQLFPDLTVDQNLRTAQTEEPGPGPELDIHALLPALDGLLQRKAGLLSGGEQQQVAIARALLRRPSVLLLDEPTEGLSPIVMGEIAHVLEQLAGEGLTVVLAEQHRAVVERICDAFLLMRSGEPGAGGVGGHEVLDEFSRRI
jgi:ABC-type branched-subunit amino acid transport system ATPase component